MPVCSHGRASNQYRVSGAHTLCEIFTNFSSIIAIPGFGTLAAAHWQHEALLERLSAATVNAVFRFYAYDLQDTFEGKFSWSHILEKGTELVNVLLDHKKSSEVNAPPQKWFQFGADTSRTLPGRRYFCVMALVECF